MNGLRFYVCFDSNISQDDVKVIMKICVRWNHVYIRNYCRLQFKTNPAGNHVTYWATRAPTIIRKSRYTCFAVRSKRTAWKRDTWPFLWMYSLLKIKKKKNTDETKKKKKEKKNRWHSVGHLRHVTRRQFDELRIAIKYCQERLTVSFRHWPIKTWKVEYYGFGSNFGKLIYTLLACVSQVFREANAQPFPW